MSDLPSMVFFTCLTVLPLLWLVLLKSPSPMGTHTKRLLRAEIVITVRSGSLEHHNALRTLYVLINMVVYSCQVRMEAINPLCLPSKAHASSRARCGC